MLFDLLHSNFCRYSNMNGALEAKILNNMSSSVTGTGGSTILNSEVFDLEWSLGDHNLESFIV